MMEKVNISLQNCYGIRNMNQELNFNNSNVIAVYARNGLMKTSLAKTFQSVQNNKVDDVCDAIFGDAGSVTIQIDGREITSNDVFVIKSFESSYESDITALLVKETVKEQLCDVLKARDKLLKALEKASGLKIKKTTGGKTNYELETTIVDDFEFDETSILLNLDTLQNAQSTLYCGSISYATWSVII